MRLSVLVMLALAPRLVGLSPSARAAEPPLAAVELVEVRHAPEGGLEDALDEDIAQRLRIAANLLQLETEGRRLSTQWGVPVPAEPRFSWPLVDLMSGQFSPWIVSNFVDQDPSYPGDVEDYRCGERTYDTSDGYNHTGIDIAVWPFPWWHKARGHVAAVAAAPGQIIDRRDGNPDDSCSLSGGTSNTIVLEHADGSASFYRHFKNGSVTPKQIGDSVTRGEYLGLVASSGNSTGPHIHFAARNALEELIEPYAGFCNAQANGLTSWWLDQRPYRDYHLIDLATHSGAPTNPPCPQPENPNFKRLFSAGQQVRVGAFFRDPTPEDGAILRVFRPDGALYADWSFNHVEERNGVAVYWQFDLPDILLPQYRGRWILRATYTDADGATIIRSRSFWVGALFADDFERVNLTDAGWILPLPPPPGP